MKSIFAETFEDSYYPIKTSKIDPSILRRELDSYKMDNKTTDDSFKNLAPLQNSITLSFLPSYDCNEVNPKDYEENL